MEDIDIGQAFQRRPGVVLLVVLGFVGLTLGFSLLQTTVYEASAILLVGVRQEPDDFINQASLQLDTRATADAIDQRPVAEEVIRRLDLPVSPEEFLEQLRVEQIPDTQFIDVSYVDPSPQRAQSIANAVALVASQESRQEAPFVYDLRIYVYERASVPTTPVSPNRLRNSILALVLGLVVGIGLALLMERRAT
jgi:capsular polysaccharide biosynthesis protein